MSQQRPWAALSTGATLSPSLRSPALPAIAALGVALLIVFAWWIVAAEAIYVWL